MGLGKVRRLLKMKKSTHRPSLVTANPEQWSEQSKRSVAYDFRNEYEDIAYNCVRCEAACVFTAEEQKHTFEVKKASIHQRRYLCASCWAESHRLKAALLECESSWMESKKRLERDVGFLTRWMDLLKTLEAYEPGKQDTARKNMLTKLISSVVKD